MEVNVPFQNNSLINLLSESGLFESKGQIRRLFKQGAIRVNGERVVDGELNLKVAAEKKMVIKAGKKLFLTITP